MTNSTFGRGLAFGLAGVLALLGVLTSTAFATADDVVPTVTVPTVTLPVTVPTATLPTTTVSTTIGTTPATTTSTTTTAGAATTTTTTSTAPASGSSHSSAPVGQPAREVRLSTGVVSVDAASILPPVRLVITRLHWSPDRLRGPARLSVSLVLRDSRQRVVRGAVVTVRAIGTGRTALASTRTDGAVTLRLFLPTLAPRRSLTVRVAANSPYVVTSRAFRIAVR